MATTTRRPTSRGCRFDGYDPAAAVTEKAGYGFREFDIAHRGLTARERVVAAGLVASRKTNREVAAELYLSTWALEYYLANVFAKVGVRSGHELSACCPRCNPSVSRETAVAKTRLSCDAHRRHEEFGACQLNS